MNGITAARQLVTTAKAPTLATWVWEPSIARARALAFSIAVFVNWNAAAFFDPAVVSCHAAEVAALQRAQLLSEVAGLRGIQAGSVLPAM